MAKPGPKPKPAKLKLIEGNPGKRSISEGVHLAPIAPDEPDWSEWFPVREGDAVTRSSAQLATRLAREEWRRIVPQLDHRGVLAKVDLEVLADYCVCVARIIQCERHITRHGVSVLGERGWQKNPNVTAVNQYRQQLKFYVGELGLSPSSRGRIEVPSGQEEDSPFD